MKKNPMFPAFKSGLATLLVVSAMLVGCGPKEKPVQPGVDDSPSYVTSARIVGTAGSSPVDISMTFNYDNVNKLTNLQLVSLNTVRVRDYAYTGEKIKSMEISVNNMSESVIAPVYLSDKVIKYTNTFPLGTVETTLTYDSNGRLSTVFDALSGFSNAYTYDIENNITRINVDAPGEANDYTLNVEYDKTIKNPVYKSNILLTSADSFYITGIRMRDMTIGIPLQKYAVKKVIRNGVLIDEYNYSVTGKKITRTKIGGDSNWNVTATLEIK